jgi:hypothetical protein
MLESAVLPAPVKRIYMGVNLDASSLMLPTTWLLLAAKRARGRRPDLVAGSLSAHNGKPGKPGKPGRRGARGAAKDAARLAVWVLEEWLRQLVAAGYSGRGYIVVFDRHFFLDYYHCDVAAGRSGIARFHGWMLQRAYPKPDLVLCLDAPGEVLFSRKPESSVDWLERRRRQYLSLAGAVAAFQVLDADRPLDAVFTDVVESIRTHWKATT